MTPRAFLFLASGFGAGYLPVAPGTWGSLAALPLHWLFSRLSPTGYGIALAVTVALGVASAGAAEKILDRPDPGLVVIDEIAGMLVALAPFEPSLVTWTAGFLLFRLFDIVKPFPVGWLDTRLHGGLGIMADDLAAGAYAAGCLWILLRFSSAGG